MKDILFPYIRFKICKLKRKVAFIVNAKRSITSLAQKTISLAKLDSDLDCHIFKTKHHKHAIFLARDCIDDGFDCVVAVGGDGTVNEVVNGIKLGKRTLGVFFGVIPNGSGNDFQASLGKFIPEEFIQKLVARQSKRIDLILLTSKENTKYSANIAGIGFDGFVIQSLQHFRNRWMFYGKFAYLLSMLRTFILFKKTTVHIKGDDFDYSGKLLMMAVCNGSKFGHGLTINPNAVLFDGKLNITIVGNVSFIDYIKKLNHLKRGEKIDHPEVWYYETEKVSIQMTNKQLIAEVDGEIFDTGNITFEIVKSDISLIC